MNQFNRGQGILSGPPPHVMHGMDAVLPQEVHFLKSRVHSLEMSVQELQKDNCEYRMHIQNLQNEIKEIKLQTSQPIKVVLKNTGDHNSGKNKAHDTADSNPKKDKKPGKQGDATGGPPSSTVNPDKKSKNKQKKGADSSSHAPRDRSADSRHSQCATPQNKSAKESGKQYNEKLAKGRTRDRSLESAKSQSRHKEKQSSRKHRHSSPESSTSSCPSDESDCNESVASSLSHEMIGKFDFVWCFNDVKGAWRRAKTQNKKFKEIVSRDLCSDQEGYLYRLHLCLCGATGYFTFDKFVCAGLSTSSPSSNSKLKWPVKKEFILAIVNPANEDDVLISKKRNRQFKATNVTDWIYNFCPLDNVFGFQRDFSSRFTSGDKLHVGIKFL